MLVEGLSGFRSNLTIKKATYELNNKIVSAVNVKLCVLAIFVDLAKVFHLLTIQINRQN